jgi:serpin B
MLVVVGCTDSPSPTPDIPEQDEEKTEFENESPAAPEQDQNEPNDKKEYTAKQFDFDAASDPFAASQMAFSLELFQRSVAAAGAGESTLISPLSVSMALAMTACGASGQTREQMETVLARGITFEELLMGMGAMQQKMQENQKVTTQVANSLWLRQSAIRLEETFLRNNEEYFGSVVYERPFNNQTLEEINAWVSDHTGGMIPSILKEIDSATVMYLINALYFEAQWREPYRYVAEGTFTTADGTVRQVETLRSSESYYDDGLAQGFSKYYDGYGYQFVAMLPNEGVSIEEYVAGLTYENLLGMLREGGVSNYIAVATLPKFELEYDAGDTLMQILKDMGMVDAFEASQADFSAMGSATDGPLYVNSVIHKTAMSVDENGTCAAAATPVGPGSGGMPEIVYLTFDRPFVCMIVDSKTKIPLFMGVVMDVE